MDEIIGATLNQTKLKMGESVFSINFNLVSVRIGIIMTDPIHGLKNKKSEQILCLNLVYPLSNSPDG